MAAQRIAATNVFRQGHRLILPSSTDLQSQDDLPLQQNRIIINIANAKTQGPCLGGYPSLYLSDVLKGICISNPVFTIPQVFNLKNNKDTTIKNINTESNLKTSNIEDLNIFDVSMYRDIENGKEDDVNDKAIDLFNKKHYFEAVKLFYAASQRGNNNALYNLAQCLFEGKGLPENKGKAIMIWKDLSKKNHSDSCYQLAVCLINGIGIEQNREQGIEEMEKASSLKHPEATYFLAVKNMKSPDFDEDLLKRQMSLLIAASPKYENKFKQFLGYKDFPERVSVVVRQILSNIDREYNRCFQSFFIKFPF
ncbi:Sel1-like repeat and Tetratricopeptide-like helical domain-containing protein [Strongyloides ratti]|uniref:Sel1-like repeat and Tetratricopeptide-like helical domain-containing protein n=1 Tax=Strongyloides ratti TaxID=34506 RepID=A0A090L512_STRRB|nr:Sel1-like repeat and Tetratricopeptide-like helical domain-containing protein [Strongyloides ratti]CEF64891.1 Sel1-like repeat and Tetratricopeptide-like helical domain-containing protein [Strongyloides ratti]